MGSLRAWPQASFDWGSGIGLEFTAAPGDVVFGSGPALAFDFSVRAIEVGPPVDERTLEINGETITFNGENITW